MISDKTKNDIFKAWGSSVTAVTICSPLELLKMNAQVTSNSTKISNMFREIRKVHGYSGFYKGIGVSLLAQPGYWGFYFPIYNNLKPQLQNIDGSIDLYKKMGIVTTASITASVIINPLFVFKTRFQTSVLKGINVSYLQMAKDIIKHEGIRGFYKGNIVAQLKNSQMMIQMPLHDYINNHPLNPLQSSNVILFDRAFISGTIAKTVASCMIFYPMDVIRTNLRDQVQYKSISQITKEICSRPGGLLNFYRGVGIYWMSAVPTFGLTMFIYENVSFEKIFEKMRAL